MKVATPILFVIIDGHECSVMYVFHFILISKHEASQK